MNVPLLNTNNGEIPQCNWEHSFPEAYIQRESPKITLQVGQSNGIAGGACRFRAQEGTVTGEVEYVHGRQRAMNQDTSFNFNKKLL